MVGIGTENDILRARAEHAAKIHEDSQLQTDLTASKQVISELGTDNHANRSHIRAMAAMFDVIA